MELRLTFPFLKEVHLKTKQNKNEMYEKSPKLHPILQITLISKPVV